MYLRKLSRGPGGGATECKIKACACTACTGSIDLVRADATVALVLVHNDARPHFIQRRQQRIHRLGHLPTVWQEQSRRIARHLQISEAPLLRLRSVLQVPLDGLAARLSNMRVP